MRIAYILNSRGIGGAERLVFSLAERMRARGHAVTILVLMAPVSEQWSTLVDVIHLDLRESLWSLIPSWFRAAQVIRAFQPDILHSHNFHGNVLGRSLKLARPGVRVISTIHNVYEGGPMRMAAYRVSDPLSGCTVTVCQAAADRMVGVHAVPRRKCTVIANGIDAHEFSPDMRRRDDMRRQMGVDDGFIWVAAGRVVPAKNYENLLRAFAWMRQGTERAELWIAGDGKGEYAEQMRALGVELGLADSIRWLGLRRDMVALLDAADGFALSSAWEGMPLALGEAMAMEKPVVATDVGGVRELVGDCGTLVPAGNSAALAQGMLEVMHATLATRQQMGHAARQRIVERFSSEANAVAWETLYRSELMTEK
jgi:glycosyltransferase involved in cell wall biosynthesis